MLHNWTSRGVLSKNILKNWGTHGIIWNRVSIETFLHWYLILLGICIQSLLWFRNHSHFDMLDKDMVLLCNFHWEQLLRWKNVIPHLILTSGNLNPWLLQVALPDYGIGDDERSTASQLSFMKGSKKNTHWWSETLGRNGQDDNRTESMDWDQQAGCVNHNFRLPCAWQGKWGEQTKIISFIFYLVFAQRK